jgi:hypothetical protein
MISAQEVAREALSDLEYWAVHLSKSDQVSRTIASELCLNVSKLRKAMELILRDETEVVSPQVPRA